MKTSRFFTGIIVLLGLSSNSFSQIDSYLQKSKQLSKWIQGDRYIKEAELVLNAQVGEVFPLLCPTLEYDWLNGWKCIMYYSNTGIAEKNCIFSFSTGFPLYKRLFYNVTEYNVDERIVFNVFVNKLFIMLIEMDLESLNDKKTKLKLKYTLTGISKKGNKIAKLVYNKEIPKGIDEMNKDLVYWLDKKVLRPIK
jgi:hypothetical protein